MSHAHANAPAKQAHPLLLRPAHSKTVPVSQHAAYLKEFPTYYALLEFSCILYCWTFAIRAIQYDFHTVSWNYIWIGPKLPSLSALRAFEAAARHQSLSAAARELNVTHAAIAQHVRQLEAELSEPLLYRAGRGVAPTEAGQQLARQLGEGFALIAEGVDTLRQQTAARPLAVSLTPSFAINWLMPRMGGFWQAHPDVMVSLTPNTALVDLRREGFDMAIPLRRRQLAGP